MNVYVTLVMNKNHYVKGALAMAHSLKLTGTKFPIICMITSDIIMYRDILLNVFDYVITVPYIKFYTDKLATNKQNNIYKEWKDISFTKWNCLKLPYDKVCFLDADLIIKENIDHLFDLQAPAGCFGNNWSSQVKYYDDIKHGEPIKEDVLNSGLFDGYVVNGHCVILEPSDNIFKQFMLFMNSGLYKKHKKCLSMTDEVALVKFLSSKKKQWTQIGRSYNCIPWKTNTKIHIYHFFNKEKAWQMNRDEWPDLDIWYDVWDSMCKKYAIVNTLLLKK